MQNKFENVIDTLPIYVVATVITKAVFHDSRESRSGHGQSRVSSRSIFAGGAAYQHSQIGGTHGLMDGACAQKNR